MPFSVLGRAALAAVAAVTFAVPSSAQGSDVPDLGQSTYVSPGNKIAFGFTVPDGPGEDIFFTMRAPTDRSWAAIGLGQDHMEGSLILMIYRDETGTGVTFSPRVAYGHYEPLYYDAMKWETLPGTGISNGTMYFSARCTEHCRSWPGGWIDVSDENQKAIYAIGPKGGFFSNHIDTSVKYHEEFGHFTINMKRTNGPADAPVLKDNSVNEGTVQIFAFDGGKDYKSICHAIFMVGSVVFLIPFGTVLLRFGNMARWHALNQSLAVLIVIVGFILGILTSFWYTRSRGFHATHQIVGLIVVTLLLAQFSLGFLNHFKHTKQQQTSTVYKTAHRWLGRIVMALGAFNAFLGFSFALNRKFNYFLAAFIILMLIISLLYTFGSKWMRRRTPPKFDNQSYDGYSPEPWRQGSMPSSTATEAGAPPAYEAPIHQNQNIGLTSMVAEPARPNKEQSGSREPRNEDLGSAHQPREMV